MTTLALSPPPHPDELEALIEEARRRQRRRRRGIASALLVIGAGVGVALWLAIGDLGHSRPVAHTRPPGHPATTPRIVGAQTNLLMWPAGKPVFGDLPGGGSGTTARIVELGTGRSRVTRIPQIVGGDFPYTLVPAGPWIVYNSARGIAAIRSDLHGPMRILGQAAWFVPGVRGSIWLADRRASPVRPTGASPRQRRDRPTVTAARAAQQHRAGHHRHRPRSAADHRRSRALPPRAVATRIAARDPRPARVRGQQPVRRDPTQRSRTDRAAVSHARKATWSVAD